MTLTGDMLDLLTVTDFSVAGMVKIGFKDKASREKSSWMRDKGFNFVGLTSQEQGFIMRQFANRDLNEVRVDDLVDTIATDFLQRTLSEDG